MTTRRSFIKKAIGTAVLSGAAPSIIEAKSNRHVSKLLPNPIPEKRYAANDNLNVGVIGMGIMGFDNMHTTTRLPGIKLVGACDLYTGRLDHAKELYGKDLFTTKNYQELLDRKDIDAIFVCTTDHWHDRISIDALNKGKHVYCEKPMVHKLEEGAAVIAAQKKQEKYFRLVASVQVLSSQKKQNSFLNLVSSETSFW